MPHSPSNRFESRVCDWSDAMRPFRLLPAIMMLGFFSALPVLAQDVITYHVDPQAAERMLKIRIDIPRVKDPVVRVQIPVWAPGAYMVGNYAANIADLSAEDADHKPLHVFHPDQNTWEIAANGAQ